jgi:hypothetical protein
MIKRLLLLTAIFGFAVSCNDYEDDFANLNDQLNGVNAKLDNIQSTVDGIADIQLELLNINSALAAISTAIGDLPTVEDIANLSALVSSTSASLAAQMSDLDADLQAIAANIITQLDAMEVMIENGFSSVNVSLAALNTNIQIIDGEIEVLQTSVDANGTKIDANGNAIMDLAGAVAVVDGKIVAVDGKLDTVLSDLTGQLATMLADITAQFTAVNDGIDANQAEALIWYLNVMTGIGRVETELDNVDADNLAIMNQLQAMLIVINDGFVNQSAELTAAQTAIILEITNAQTAIATNLTQINALTALVNTLSQTVTDNDTSVDAQLAAINALIANLQADVTTLLDHITTVYNGNLTITNDAELAYAVELRDKVMVINGKVEINTTFATTAEKVTSIIGVMDKFNTVTGDIEIVSTSDLTANSLVSVGGDYSVNGNPVLTPSFVNAANNVTLYYDASEDYVTSFQHIGGTLTIQENSAATVDFSNVVSVGAFSIVSAADVTVETNTLNDPTTVDLGAISESDLAGTPSTNTFTVDFNAAKTVDVSLKTDTNLTVTGAQDLVGIVADGNVVAITAGAITGNVDVDAAGNAALTATSISNGTGGSITFDSDGQTIDVPTVVTGQFNIEDNGGNNTANFTDIKYTSVTASSFSLLDNGTGNLNVNILTANLDATGAAWNVDSSTITSNKKVSWLNAIPQLNAGGTVEVGMLHVDGVNGATTADKFPAGESANSTTIENGLDIDGDLTVNINGSLNGFDLYLGQINGELTVNAKNNTVIQFIMDDPYTVDVKEYLNGGNAAVTTTGAGNVTFLARYIDPAGAVFTTDGNARSSYTTVTNDTIDLTAVGNITIKAGSTNGLDVNVGGTASIGQASSTFGIWQFTAVGAGSVDFVGTVIRGAVYSLFDINVGGDALINNYDFNGYPNMKGVSVIAGGEIQAQGFTQLYGAEQGTTPEAQSYTFQSGTGNIDLSNLVGIGFDEPSLAGNANTTLPRASNVSITSTSGNINLSSLTAIKTTADGTTTIDAGTGNVDTHELSTHDGSSLTVAGTLIMVEDLVSSTGDLTLNGDLVLEDGVTTAGASPLLATWDTLTVGSDILVELPAHVDATAGAMTLTLAQTVSTNSITIAEVSAPAMTSLTLTDQSTAFDLVANDFGNSAVAAYTIDITGNAALDAMSFTNVDNVSGLTTAGNVDTFVVNGMDGLTSITAGHTNGTNPVGTKLHIIDNTQLTSYTSATSKMHEIIITGNTAMTALDLSSYLDGAAATSAATASDLATVDFVLNVVGNGITGTFTPKDNSGTPDTALDSAELGEVKTIATHLLGFTQANSVTAVADFLVGAAALSANADAADIYNADTDFTDGINTLAEFALLND